MVAERRHRADDRVERLEVAVDVADNQVAHKSRFQVFEELFGQCFHRAVVGVEAEMRLAVGGASSLVERFELRSIAGQRPSPSSGTRPTSVAIGASSHTERPSRLINWRFSGWRTCRRRWQRRRGAAAEDRRGPGAQRCGSTARPRARRSSRWCGPRAPRCGCRCLPHANRGVQRARAPGSTCPLPMNPTR